MGTPAPAMRATQPSPWAISAGRVSSFGEARSHSSGPARSTTAATLPPALMIPAATAASRGPHPATITGDAGTTPWDFSRTVAAARPITPGRVQPGNGTTRSCAPVAAIRRGASKTSLPSGPSASTRNAPPTDQTRRPSRTSAEDFASAARRASPSRRSGEASSRTSPAHGARHTWPPAAGCSSMTTTRKPTPAAARAAFAPAGPAPRTITSWVTARPATPLPFRR